MKKRPDVETDNDFQEKDWRAERVMWFLLLLFVLAGLIGVFGRGGISKAKKVSPDQKMEVQYQRFLRYHTKDRLDIFLQDLPADSTFSIEIDKKYVNNVQVESIHPAPEKTLITSNGVAYFFRNGNAHQAEIIFYISPDKLGNVKTALTYHNQSVEISQFIYP
ncbi:MAG: hypothetical protein EOP53_08930 [Sphingobacteriales bacterium]|nr:MAG: hypothetical protein EOP53_08930 [Sphingobacteriales bacterium]